MKAEIVEHTGLGTVPCMESCEQLGPHYDVAAARAEARRFVQLLDKLFRDRPEGARFKITANPHDFGTYYDVMVLVPETQEGYAWGRLVEDFAPATWASGDTVPRFVARPADGTCTVCGDPSDELAFFARRGMEKGEWVCLGCDESLSSVDPEEIALDTARSAT